MYNFLKFPLHQGFYSLWNFNFYFEDWEDTFAFHVLITFAGMRISFHCQSKSIIYNYHIDSWRFECKQRHNHTCGIALICEYFICFHSYIYIYITDMVEPWNLVFRREPLLIFCLFNGMRHWRYEKWNLKRIIEASEGIVSYISLWYYCDTWIYEVSSVVSSTKDHGLWSLAITLCRHFVYHKVWIICFKIMNSRTYQKRLLYPTFSSGIFHTS